MFRREFLAAASLALARPKPVILLRSGWQTVNIGDIAHTPGLLTVIERIIPQTQVILWPGNIEGETEPMLRRRFPRLRIAKGGIGADGLPDTDALREAFRVSDILIHGSAASASSIPQFEAWRRHTRKPYGYFGVGFTPAGEAAGVGLSGQLRSLLDGASFLFTRETASLRNVRDAGIRGPETAFAPDGTFSMDVTDEARALQFMKEAGLQPGKFICIVPRLRYTPYHKIRKVDWTPAEIARREEVNRQHAEPDHAKLREVAIAWIRKTGGRVLFCPEMVYETEILDRLLYDLLPGDVKSAVVLKKSFWLPDEAASVYKRAAVVVSFECHSPIIAAGQGTPCVYVHQPEDGIKGHMWEDIGLGDWFFEVERTSAQALAGRVLDIATHGAASRAKVMVAVRYARKLQDERMASVRSRLR